MRFDIGASCLPSLRRHGLAQARRYERRLGDAGMLPTYSCTLPLMLRTPRGS